MRRFYSIIFLIGTAIFVSCDEVPQGSETREPISFLVAGHVYGAPGVDNEGFHPPFSAYLMSSDLSDIAYSFLTGDVVLSSTEKDWVDVYTEMDAYQMDWHIAPGNHDLKNYEIYEEYVGDRYYSFQDDRAVYVMLDATENNWNIVGEQLQMFEEALETATSEDLLFFVFMHQLLWYEDGNQYSTCTPNSLEGKVGESNFLTELIPLAEASGAITYFFAGDVGAFENGCSIMYDDRGAMHFIASGMGGGKSDNLIQVNIMGNSEVELEVIALNGEERNGLGLIEDWQI